MGSMPLHADTTGTRIHSAAAGTTEPIAPPCPLTEDNAPELTSAERMMLDWLRFGVWNARRNAVALGHADVLRRRFVTFHELLLAHGKLFRPVGFPPDLDPGTPGTCWVSSWVNADSHGVIYVEGIAATAERVWIEHEHGWCARPGDADALDPTWSPPGLAYLGVPITAEFRADAVARQAAPRLLYSGHGVGRSLLHDGVPEDAIVPDTGEPLPQIARLTS